MTKLRWPAHTPRVTAPVIRSALVLRDAIVRAPSVLSPLGGFQAFVSGDEIVNRHDFLTDPDVPSDMYSDLPLAIGDSLAIDSYELASSFASQPELPPEGHARLVSITHGGCAGEIAIDAVSADSITRIYDAAPRAAFGDMKAMETRIDPLVRSGRELDATHFSVSPALCKWVENTWAAHFEPKPVRAEPYKINLYGPGDRFAPHRDTPQKNLIGTFLLALSGWGPPSDGGGLVVHDTDGQYQWDGASGWAAFMPYLVHEVEPIVAGVRATLAFKVFATSDEVATGRTEWLADALQAAADQIAWCCNDRGQVGVLLSFAYSLNCTALCGRDLFVYRAMQTLGTVESIPVAVHVRASADTADTYHWFANADVYALSQENLSVLMTAGARTEPQAARELSIPFIPMTEGHEVYRNNHPSIDWTGNYADPANVDTLYVHRALILTTAADVTRAKVRCPAISLAKVDLSGRDLRFADLSETSFRNAMLAGANLQEANLSYAYFEDATLTAANLSKTDLTSAEMEGAILEKVNLAGATLHGTNLKAAILVDADLTDVKWDYETVWPDDFDPMACGAPLPVELNRARTAGSRPEPAGTTTNSLGMKFIPVPAGKFLMGTPGDEGEEFLHVVRITKPFFLGMHQVTQAEYEQVTGRNPSLFKGPNLPVEHVSWQDAERFCELLSALPAEQDAGCRYRLPTEAEWEYACRAGTTTTFNTGNRLEADHAHFASSTRYSPKHTMPVGSFPPNAWGLFDMHGNVWEWTSDWFSAGYYRESPTDDPQGPSSGTHHTLRGGSASVTADECTSALRGEARTVDGPSDHPVGRFEKLGDFGIRVVCEMA